ncbi:MAG: pyruvate kinase [Gemmatales bacterium]|nr:pyruvate kinase [Gemmatales bacterium]MDW7994662.1 pyruvate kinase [Gemmatales bacterium]
MRLPRTKIVATLGPASETEEKIRQLAEAGVSVFRLNSAHGQPVWHDRMAKLVRRVAEQLGRPLAILQDLSGPKWRLGDLSGGALHLALGQTFRLVKQPSPSSDALTCNYPHLLDQLAVGTTLVFADGTVSAEVVEKLSDGVRLRVTYPGEIRSRQGIAAPGAPLNLPTLTEKDLRDLDDAARRRVDYVGLSFVAQAADVERLRQELQRRYMPAAIVAKIERACALDHLDDIISASDAIMVARGDLGVETELARVPLVQKQIIARCRFFSKPVITATQMLESMRYHSQPTRAEVSDVANAILDGTDAVMLSAETASGLYPVEAVHTMRQIAQATEAAWVESLAPFPLDKNRQGTDLLTATVRAAAQLADQIHAKLVVVATQGGHSALAISKQRLRTPVLAFSHRPETVSQMCLYWGVTPVFLPKLAAPSDFLPVVRRWLHEHGWTQPGDRIVFVLGSHWSGTGCHSLLVYEA